MPAVVLGYHLTMANGIISVNGNQTGIIQGSAAIGPFSIPCSQIGATIIAPLNATTTIAVPSEGTQLTSGVVLIASAAASMTCSAGFISGQLTKFSPLGYPCIWTWDAATIPTNVYVTVSNNTGAYVVVQFF